MKPKRQSSFSNRHHLTSKTHNSHRNGRVSNSNGCVNGQDGHSNCSNGLTISCRGHVFGSRSSQNETTTPLASHHQHPRGNVFTVQFSMSSVFVLSVVLLLLTASRVGDARVSPPDPSEKILHHDLMENYQIFSKPSAGSSNMLTVRMGLRLSQVLDVDEKNQVLTLSVWLRQEWYDPRLQWHPADYGGVLKLNMPSKDLWIPDIVLYNNADGDFVVTHMTMAAVYYDGKIVWEPPAIFKSYCPIDVEYFPFDIQECFLKFSTWSYDGLEVDLQHVCKGIPMSEDGEVDESTTLVIPRGIDLKDYYYNVEWDILNVTARRTVKFYPCCPQPYPDITFNVTLRRRKLYYTLNLIIPCISISSLTVLVFYLPTDSGEKMTLSISILLALTVFFLLLSDMVPSTSLVIPLIGKYLLFVMIVVTASVFLSVYTLHIHFKSPSTDKMSPWVRKIFTVIMPRILGMKRPGFEVLKLQRPPRPPDKKTAAGDQAKPASGIEEGPQDEETLISYENLRESASSSSAAADPEGTRFPMDVAEALKEVRYIANSMRQADEDLCDSPSQNYPPVSESSTPRVYLGPTQASKRSLGRHRPQLARAVRPMSARSACAYLGKGLDPEVVKLRADRVAVPSSLFSGKIDKFGATVCSTHPHRPGNQPDGLHSLRIKTCKRC